MSPHVANFVHDLVAMAKAMEENPVLQEQIEALKAQLSQAQDHNAGLEVNIISYKQQIDDLQAKVRSLEVERDDASFRTMEVEDKLNTTLVDLSSILRIGERIHTRLTPPKPEPVIEPEAERIVDHYDGDKYTHSTTGDWTTPVDTGGVPAHPPAAEPNREGLEYDKATDAWYPKAVETVQGQSEVSPTVPSQEDQSPSVGIGETHAEASGASTISSVPQPEPIDFEPTPKYSYEWYQWNDRRNERAAKVASGH